ncbi:MULTISPECIES: anhydro-N-acetylmuramic acid kinase [Cysteiniphilum]|uniref:Anhydro-N-acetylmuramic acid kinase n=1 Tax=Cysteiniphilum litorale TaxID=2056700 RepID=A0A8J2Z355_9GAMM|nr:MULTISPECIES: anhydro-N-acetylmuramic acid kinase [Cysteiniphilum]GGF89676.1 anhydro-N-acetylmuramic acid kinase [Cysteiniphilum litorale]
MSGKYYIGIMSGTSMDAIDCVVVDFKDDSFSLKAQQSFAYPAEIKARIKNIFAQDYQLSLFDFGDLDYQLAESYAQCVTKILTENNLNAEDIIAIGCHGQTVYHQPQGVRKFSIQLGSGNVLTALTGIPVINDFRNKDMIFGGQGAPLVPVFHQAFFADKGTPRVILNLGGIANITCLHPKKPLIGFDTGPANTLIDQWINKHRGQAYDQAGHWGRGGILLPKLLDRLMQDPYFAQSAPKSTGLEYFNLQWLENQLSTDEHIQDVQATLHHLTARSIAEAILRYQADTKALYVAGGGARNEFLLDLLQEYLPAINVQAINALGVDEAWIEAIAFAWFAYCHINKIKIAFSATTGSKKDVIAGSYHAC